MPLIAVACVLAVGALVVCNPLVENQYIGPTDRIVFCSDLSFSYRNCHIFVMDINGTNRTQLTFGDYYEYYLHPAWSPGGSRIVFTQIRYICNGFRRG
jgi:Tol biopolymer transport system component